jgi:multicomponent Na+:H+ antiporter subunit B
MRSLILTTATKYLLPLLILFSIFIWLRGHNEPGGGFVGGLIAASAYVLYGIAFGIGQARDMLRIHPRMLIGIGLLTVLISGLLPVFLKGQPFMTAIWGENEYPIFHKLGTPVMFDTGIYITVIGVTLWIIFSLADEYLIPGKNAIIALSPTEFEE